MKIAVTGATGFVGRELVSQLAADDHELRCWYRTRPDQSAESDSIQWLQGELATGNANELVNGCDAVVHAALWRPGTRFQGAEGDVVEFARINVLGTLELIQAAIDANVSRFIFVSTCAVHDKILDDRPLDEAHPLWPHSHYGAHKAAIEKFVHSFGLGKYGPDGNGFPICSIRPTGVYGVRKPVADSKWYSLIQRIAAGTDVEVNRGGKEVHVSDVAKAIRLLLSIADTIKMAGHSFSCYDRYISEFDVATIAKKLTGSQSQIVGSQKSPKHQIDSSKIKSLGMQFGGDALLEATVKALLD